MNLTPQTQQSQTQQQPHTQPHTQRTVDANVWTQQPHTHTQRTVDANVNVNAVAVNNATEVEQKLKTLEDGGMKVEAGSDFRGVISEVQPVWETWLVEGPLGGVTTVLGGRSAGWVRSERRQVTVPGRYARQARGPGGRWVCGLGDSGVVPVLSLSSLLEFLGSSNRVRVLDGGVNGDCGIDLAVRGHEVRKLFYAGGFTRTLLREGIDPEDFLQEVYRGLLTRNNGTCPWDHKKSSFGHYVHIVIRCLLSNYLRKERRRTSVEEVTEDCGLKVGGSEVESYSKVDLLRGLFTTDVELDTALKIVGGLEAGKSRREVATELGLGLVAVDGYLREIRMGLST